MISCPICRSVPSMVLSKQAFYLRCDCSRLEYASYHDWTSGSWNFCAHPSKSELGSIQRKSDGSVRYRSSTEHWMPFHVILKLERSILEIISELVTLAPIADILES